MPQKMPELCPICLKIMKAIKKGVNWCTCTDISRKYNFDSFLLASWRMDNDWIDSTGNKMDGTPYGTKFNGFHKLGTHSGEFDGNSFIKIKRHDELDLVKNFTIAAWIHPLITDKKRTIFSKTTDDDWCQWSLVVEDGFLKLYYKYNGKGSLMGGSVLSGEWTHVAASVNNHLYSKIYVNGKLANFARMPHVVVSNPYAPTIGAAISKKIQKDYYYGFIDGLAMWNKILSEEDVKNLYNNGKGIEV